MIHFNATSFKIRIYFKNTAELGITYWLLNILKCVSNFSD